MSVIVAVEFLLFVNSIFEFLLIVKDTKELFSFSKVASESLTLVKDTKEFLIFLSTSIFAITRLPLVVLNPFVVPLNDMITSISPDVID